MWRNSLGQYTVGATFVPAWYSTTKPEFKPIEYKRIDCETKETKTTESVCSTSTQPEGGITPQNQQADASEAE